MTSAARPDESRRPLITLALLSYNQERFIEEAVRSAFAQTYDHLEIILSDDRSTDGTFAIMEALAEGYRGPHRVTVRRPPHNLGIGAHVENLFRLASGEIVVIAAGDDISEPDRVDELARIFSENRAIHCVCSDLITIEANELMAIKAPSSVEELLARKQYLIGASCGYRKELVTGFRPLVRGIVYEDEALTLRALISGGAIRVIDRPLVRYRTAAGLSAYTRIEVEGYRSASLGVLNARLAMCRQWTIDLVDADKAGMVNLIQPYRAEFILRKYLLFKKDVSIRTLATFRKYMSIKTIAYHFAGIRLARSMGFYQRLRRLTRRAKK